VSDGNQYAGLGSVVKLDTNISKACLHCPGEFFDGEDIDNAINHYVQKHHYRVLHVGTETSHGQDGKPWHNTVAIVGI